ncbi:hypothetical protein HPB51_002464 [Rhipicephalus microplus]|uniref:Uncharacterized protein n=1 Tax=Rhipicephalus microplus TaxID=6941 RepID=A0A9J6DEW0_RHIMP|nr:hypothetical protein HPB51_002464 [Rhipicephalus microplus]
MPSDGQQQTVPLRASGCRKRSLVPIDSSAGGRQLRRRRRRESLAWRVCPGVAISGASAARGGSSAPVVWSELRVEVAARIKVRGLRKTTCQRGIIRTSHRRRWRAPRTRRPDVRRSHVGQPEQVFGCRRGRRAAPARPAGAGTRAQPGRRRRASLLMATRRVRSRGARRYVATIGISHSSPIDQNKALRFLRMNTRSPIGRRHC